LPNGTEITSINRPPFTKINGNKFCFCLHPRSSFNGQLLQGQLKLYEKDPAIVTKEAFQEACRSKSDVVLVDTAGRMQDNEPLMRALSNINSPNLVLLVGEALVGNDAVDQITKFDQKLADLSTSANARLIDGILLTKFDTIDDKVGAALSMVYISGADFGI
jgi:signal recognition particle receptor subunit alpha